MLLRDWVGLVVAGRVAERVREAVVLSDGVALGVGERRLRDGLWGDADSVAVVGEADVLRL